MDPGILRVQLNLPLFGLRGAAPIDRAMTAMGGGDAGEESVARREVPRQTWTDQPRQLLVYLISP